MSFTDAQRLELERIAMWFRTFREECECSLPLPADLDDVEAQRRRSSKVDRLAAEMTRRHLRLTDDEWSRYRSYQNQWSDDLCRAPSKRRPVPAQVGATRSQWRRAAAASAEEDCLDGKITWEQYVDVKRGQPRPRPASS
ncbi:MAG: hypothetical protein AAGF91_07405 [Actinomycetota bacterium]